MGTNAKLGICAAVISCPAVTVVPESSKVPVVGIVVMMMEAKALEAGASSTSVRPKSATLKT